MLDELQKLKEQLNKLEQENTTYKTLLEKHQIILPELEQQQHSAPLEAKEIESPLFLSLQQKIALYRSYFRGRDDVYPIRWENKQGRSGYSPACFNEWVPAFCQKPKIKCGDCPNQKWKSLAEQVIYDHLAGKHLIGVYPLLLDDRCYFLTLDFDKNTWQADVVAFSKTCEAYEVPILIEKSQSGNGAHIWIFFEEAIPASMARPLGTALLTLTMQNYPGLAFSSYDRLFPDQDTLSKGGFGNLIALPLQGARRKKGCSTFVDSTNEFLPYADPWKILSNTKKLTTLEVIAILKRISEKSLILDVPRAIDDEGDSFKPWEKAPTLPKYPEILESLPTSITIVKANLLFIPTSLPPKLIIRCKNWQLFRIPNFIARKRCAFQLLASQELLIAVSGLMGILACHEVVSRIYWNYFRIIKLI